MTGSNSNTCLYYLFTIHLSCSLVVLPPRSYPYSAVPSSASSVSWISTSSASFSFPCLSPCLSSLLAFSRTNPPHHHRSPSGQRERERERKRHNQQKSATCSKDGTQGTESHVESWLRSALVRLDHGLEKLRCNFIRMLIHHAFALLDLFPEQQKQEGGDKRLSESKVVGWQLPKHQMYSQANVIGDDDTACDCRLCPASPREYSRSNSLLCRCLRRYQPSP